MPNHVENHISLQGDPKKIRSMLEAIKSDELGIGSVDFNKIIPMPESLTICRISLYLPKKISPWDIRVTAFTVYPAA